MGVIYMFYNPELFVYLMFLPVICLVVLPALFSTTRVCMGIVRKNKIAQESCDKIEQEQVFDEEMLAEA